MNSNKRPQKKKVSVPCSNITKDGSQCSGGKGEPLCYVCRRRLARQADPNTKSYFANVKLKKKEKKEKRKLSHRRKERELHEETKRLLDSITPELLLKEKKRERAEKFPKFVFML